MSYSFLSTANSSPEKSTSVPGKAQIVHELGDTLKRTITLKSGGVVIDLTGSTIEVIVSADQDGTAIATLVVGDGLVASDLVNGQFKIFWQTSGNITKGTYWYKVRVTFTDASEKTYLEDKLIIA